MTYDINKVPKQEKQSELSEDSEEEICRGGAYDLTKYSTVIELLRTTVCYAITLLAGRRSVIYDTSIATIILDCIL